jgi:S1-C subfamily serine protease
MINKHFSVAFWVVYGTANLLLLASAALAFVALAGCAHVQYRPGMVRDRDTQARTAVRVEVLCVHEDPFLAADGSTHVGGGWGSGVIVDARHVVTAYHVAHCPYLPDVHVVLADGSRRRMVVRREWQQADVALLELADAGSFGPVIPPRVALAGDEETICTATSWPRRGFNCGKVEAVWDELSDQDLKDHPGTRFGDIRCALLVEAGNSGSPVYDEHGNLLGIAVDGDGMGTGRYRSLWGLRKELGL